MKEHFFLLNLMFIKVKDQPLLGSETLNRLLLKAASQS